MGGPGLAYSDRLETGATQGRSHTAADRFAGGSVGMYNRRNMDVRNQSIGGVESALRTRTSIVVGLCLAAGVCWAGAPTRAEQVIESGGIQVSVGPWSGGVRIALDGVTVSKGSHMVVTKPPWSPHYYLGPDADVVGKAVCETVDGGVRLRMDHRGGGGEFVGEDTITITPAGSVERVFEGRFTLAEGEALLQWCMAEVNPVLIVGRPYRAELIGGGVREGIVPVTAKAAEVEPSTLTKGMRSIEFDSRIGPIRIEMEGPGQPICYDFRKNRWSEASKPYFWLGELGWRIRKGSPVRYRMVMHLPPSQGELGSGKAVQARAKTTPRKDAQTYPLDEPLTIIPRPKEMKAFQRGFGVGMAEEVIVTSAPDELVATAIRPAVEELDAFLRRRVGAGARLYTGPAAPASPVITFGEAVESDRLPAEGYLLSVGGDGVFVRAKDCAGFMHAVQTLKQLVAVTADGRAFFRAVSIRDWPSLPFRGVHMFTGGKGPKLHEKLIRDVIAACKMNRIVLQSEYIEWESHPELHHPEYGMPKDEVRGLLNLCHEFGIEVIPLVMSLGHCQWMFETGHHADLAEDPDAQWAYCVTNPKTYEFIYEIYDEALGLFKPKYFHIGHDEFHHRGRVPFRESSKPYTVEELFTMDTIRHHRWFAERGVKLMMWGDMLLGIDEGPDACHAESPASAKKLRAELPKDIFVADWHYVDTAPERYTNLAAFKADGFDTVASTWNRPGNITNFAKAAYDNGSRGLLQTTWAGYSLDPGRFEASMGQYAAYVLAAEAAWNADDPPDPESYPFESRFLDLMELSSLTPANRVGWTADLSEVYNRPLAARDSAGWFGFGKTHDLSIVPGGLVRFKGLSFELGRPGDPASNSALVMRGRLANDASLPAAAEIAVGAKADQLAILHACNFADERGDKVGEYEIAYVDGETATTELVYGDNILAYTDLSAAAAAPVVWSGRNAAGQQVALRVLLWANPHPHREIRSFGVRSAGGPASPILLGLTGLIESE